MENNFRYDQVKVDSLALAAGQTSAEIIIKGNSSYAQLVGFMAIIEKTDGTIYSKNVKVSVSNSGTGEPILPLQPYHCIRPSFAEKPSDRIIKATQKASNTDFRFRIEPTNLLDDITFTVVAYFTSQK
jgi:hypothetical protein